MSRKKKYILFTVAASFVLFSMSFLARDVSSYLNSKQISETTVTSSARSCVVQGGFPVTKSVTISRDICGNEQIQDYGPFESERIRFVNFLLIYASLELVLCVVIFYLYKKSQKS